MFLEVWVSAGYLCFSGNLTGPKGGKTGGWSEDEPIKGGSGTKEVVGAPELAGSLLDAVPPCT